MPRAEGDQMQAHLSKVRRELAETQRDTGDAQRLLELRIQKLEELAYRHTADESLKQEQLDTQVEQLQTELEELEKRKAALDADKALKPPSALSRTAQVAQIERLFKAKSYQEVAEKCEAFLEEYPNDKQFNAQMLYWRGDAYCNLKEYKKAVLSFQELLTKYPKFSKIPETLYKVGQSLDELGFSKDAMIFYEETMSKHPNSPFAAKAKENLKKTQ